MAVGAAVEVAAGVAKRRLLSGGDDEVTMGGIAFRT